MSMNFDAPAAGHNSDISADHARDRLRAIVERIERLEDEKAILGRDVRDVYIEAKGNGFDLKALRTIVRLRKQDASQRSEEATILETYMIALGMI